MDVNLHLELVPWGKKPSNFVSLEVLSGSQSGERSAGGFVTES